MLHGIDFRQDVNSGDIEEGASWDQHQDADPELKGGQIRGLALAGAQTEENYNIHDGWTQCECQQMSHVLPRLTSLMLEESTETDRCRGLMKHDSDENYHAKTSCLSKWFNYTHKVGKPHTELIITRALTRWSTSKFKWNQNNSNCRYIKSVTYGKVRTQERHHRPESEWQGRLSWWKRFYWHLD